MHASIDDISVMPVSPLLARLRAAAPSLQRRVPLQADASRWHVLRIGARTCRAALPITFTPYASVRPCAARCGFCSENLRQHGGGRAATTLRPGPAYFQQLSAVLQLLRDVPLSYSLSGLEMTDDAAWLQTLLQTLATTPNGPRVEQRVLYSNGAGLACARSAVDGCAGCLRAVLDRAVASSSVAGAQRCDHTFSPRRADRRCGDLRADGTATGSTAAATMGLPRAARWRGQRRRHCAVHRLRAQLWHQPGDLSRRVAAGRCLSQQRHAALHRRAPRWRGHLAGQAHAAALVVALATRWPDRR